MATRQLTETFIFMRNNAIQNRNFLGDTRVRYPDKTKLLGEMKDIELGPIKQYDYFHEWQGMVNSLQYEFTVIRQKMKDLISLHDKHVFATTLDSNTDEDKQIEDQTRDLTQLFTLCHRQLGHISAANRKKNFVNNRIKDSLTTNVVSSLARNLQELSTTFRKSQSQYLSRLKTRDERIRGYLNLTLDSELSTDDVANLAEYDLYEPSSMYEPQTLLKENSLVAAQREQEVTQIVRSIHELNSIFRDVAQLVVDQGTLVDRIDYNVEQTQLQVGAALGQLTKAQSHQKGNRKLVIIFVLACVVMVLGTILLVSKFTR